LLKSNISGFTLRLVALLLLAAVASCNFLKKEDDYTESSNRPLARVNKTVLYYNDLPAYCQTGAGNDSSRLIASYVESWVRKQLLLQKAQSEIGPDDPEIQARVEEYTNFLIVQKYKEAYINELAALVPEEEELLDFYASETHNYESEEILYKGFFIKVPLNTPGVKNIRENIVNGTSEQEVKSFCVRYAKKYLLNTWFSEQILHEESAFRGQEKSIARKTFLEKSDSEYLYLVYIADKVEKGNAIPLDYIKSDISNIIVRQKQLKAIKQLENKMYDEARESGDVEIF